MWRVESSLIVLELKEFPVWELWEKPWKKAESGFEDYCIILRYSVIILKSLTVAYCNSSGKLGSIFSEMKFTLNERAKTQGRKIQNIYLEESKQLHSLEFWGVSKGGNIS